MSLWDFALRSIRAKEARFDPTWLLSTAATSTAAVDLQRVNRGTRMMVNPLATTKRDLFVLACGSTPPIPSPLYTPREGGVGVEIAIYPMVQKGLHIWHK
jgi:hypothetical protein